MLIPIIAALMLHSIPAADSVRPADTMLVRLSDVVPDLIADVRYATTNNFTGTKLYASDTLWGRKLMADALAHAQRLAQERGYRLKVFDAYRPLSVQRIMWNILPDERYVADPSKGSRHNRGMALDCTLVHDDGTEVDMGTSYDDFTERAAADHADLPDHILRNRRMLREIMDKAGFDVLPTEWWHYDRRGWESMSILDE